MNLRSLFLASLAAGCLLLTGCANFERTERLKVTLADRQPAVQAVGVQADGNVQALIVHNADELPPAEPGKVSGRWTALGAFRMPDGRAEVWKIQLRRKGMGDVYVGRKMYYLSQGPVFLLRREGDRIAVTQLKQDVSHLSADDSAAIKAFLLDQPKVREHFALPAR
jgi:hypothetical protein